MFSGIPGNYWFPMLARTAGRSDHRRAEGAELSDEPLYQRQIFLPRVRCDDLASCRRKSFMRRLWAAQGWENDRINVGKMLDFIGKRDRGRPFFTFMFFESPHARYYFPPGKCDPNLYPDDINYFTLSQNNFPFRRR